MFAGPQERAISYRVLGVVALAGSLAAGGPLSGQERTAEPSPGASTQELNGRVASRLESLEARLIEVRRDIHRHPEVSGEEERTAGVVADWLNELGFEVRTGVGGHGVVGVLRGARPGPMVAYRADMDAVPSNAPDPVEFRSIVPGVRHICGHDVHVTVALGIAAGLASVRDELAGSLMLVFQPAEERATGARAMLADGVFASERPDAIFAVHTAPLPVGLLGTAPGAMMAGRDLVRVRVRGTGDTGTAADSVRRIIEGAGTLPPARALEAAPAGMLLAQAFSRAEAGQGWVVNAQVTTKSDTARQRARETILQGLAGVSMPGVELETSYRERAIAGVTNDEALVARANASIGAALGETGVIPVQGVPYAFSEDFGSFQEETPGVMYFLGVSNPEKGTVGMPHSPDYVADEGAILVGARAMAAVILDWLTPH